LKFYAALLLKNLILAEYNSPTLASKKLIIQLGYPVRLRLGSSFFNKKGNITNKYYALQPRKSEKKRYFFYFLPFYEFSQNLPQQKL